MFLNISRTNKLKFLKFRRRYDHFVVFFSSFPSELGAVSLWEDLRSFLGRFG